MDNSLLYCNSETIDYLNYFPQLKQFIQKFSNVLQINCQKELIQKFQNMSIKQLLNNNNSSLSQIKDLIKETPLVLFTELVQFAQKNQNQFPKIQESKSKTLEIEVPLQNNQEEQETNQKKIIELQNELNSLQLQIQELENNHLISQNDQIKNTACEKSSSEKQQKGDEQNIEKKQLGLKVQTFNCEKDLQMQNVIIIGMQGQRNKGKTFILNSLIDEQFPSDYHVSTPGICIKYHSLNNKNIVYIDSEGLGCPITIDYENNRHYQTYMDNKLNKGCEDIQSQENLSLDITNRHQDLKATEQIQQDFIIENSNILIIVVSYLTLDDQKLIHSISQQFVIDKNNPKQKKLLVVHNLKEYHRPEYVKKYMEDLKMVFPITYQPVNNYNKTHDDENNIVFVDNIKPHINHLVMANSNSEAGRIYNKFTLYFLKQIIELYQGSTNFDVPTKLVDYLNKHLQSYVTLRKESDDAKQNPQIKDFLEYNTQKQAVMLKEGYIIDRVKELQVNVFGSLQKDCSYSIVNNDEKKERYLLIEIPGSANFKKKFDKWQGQFIIIIQQNSDLESRLGEIQASTRKLDEKYYTIQICKEKELWNLNKDKYENLSNGIHKFVFTQDIQDDFD
ncbi:hypothetical protein ABPG74_005111 [Tetrahymena malaccensis]